MPNAILDPTGGAPAVAAPFAPARRRRRPRRRPRRAAGEHQAERRAAARRGRQAAGRRARGRRGHDGPHQAGVRPARARRAGRRVRPASATSWSPAWATAARAAPPRSPTGWGSSGRACPPPSSAATPSAPPPTRWPRCAGHPATATSRPRTRSPCSTPEQVRERAAQLAGAVADCSPGRAHDRPRPGRRAGRDRALLRPGLVGRPAAGAGVAAARGPVPRHRPTAPPTR